MGKKKGRTINNIGELNLEIDYDKLAEAISRVQNRQEGKPFHPYRKNGGLFLLHFP